MIENILEVFKLEDKEKLVFLKLFELGEQPASIIAKKINIPRNTTRFILDNLSTIGLVSKSKSGNTQLYAIESQENILKAIELDRKKSIEEFEKKVNVIKQYGENLGNRFKSKKIPKIKFYEGELGIEKVYDDTLTSKEEIRSWASFDGMHEGLPKYFNTYYKRRAKNNIPIKSIHPNTDFAKSRIKFDKTEMRTSKLVDASIYNWTPEIQVYDDKINIVSWSEKIGIIIESEEISDALKTIFDIGWDKLN